MSSSPARLRVASYNIWRGRHFDARHPAPGGGSVLDDVTRLEPLRTADVLFLQEAIVGRLAASAEPRDTVAEIAMALGSNGDGPPEPRHTAFHGAPLGRDRRWGVGIVSRQPVRVEPLDVPKPFWSPWRRSALLVRAGPWILVTLHLEVWPLVGTRARRQQMDAVLVALEAISGSGDAPVVVAGDFNCATGSGPHRMLLDRGFAAATSQPRPTFRIAGVGFHLDHIYVRNARVLEAGVGSEARGSDHLPVWATVEAKDDVRRGGTRRQPG